MKTIQDFIITDESVLRKVSVDTTMDKANSLNLMNRLKEANKTAWTNGCGLSAIQIGVPLRFAWFVFGGKDHILLNPKILCKLGKVSAKEGCLSIPNEWTIVTRGDYIEYLSEGKKHKAKGQLARIIQHEIDHMDGILNKDYA